MESTFSFCERLREIALMLFEGVESHSNHMESIGSRKYPCPLLGDSLEIPRERGCLRPTFLMYSLCEPKMNISRGEVVGSN